MNSSRFIPRPEYVRLGKVKVGLYENSETGTVSKRNSLSQIKSLKRIYFLKKILVTSRHQRTDSKTELS